MSFSRLIYYVCKKIFEFGIKYNFIHVNIYTITPIHELNKPLNDEVNYIHTIRIIVSPTVHVNACVITPSYTYCW